MSRLVLAAGGKKYEDYRYKDGEWATAKGETPFGQCPVLEVNGKKYAQTFAIATYLARECGLYGKTNLDGLAIDQYVQLVGDVFMAAVKVRDVEDAKKPEFLKDFKEVQCPKFYAFFEKALSENKSGYMVGDSLSLADIVVYDLITGYIADRVASLDNFPKMKALVAKVGENPGIKAYVASKAK